jgi:ATP-dependent DNA helicase RecG
MQPEITAPLKRLLGLEAERNFDNSAAPNGTDAAVRQIARELPDSGNNDTAAFAARRLGDIWESYAGADHAKRVTIVNISLRLLGDINVASVPPSGACRIPPPPTPAPPPAPSPLDQDITYLKGVGSTRARLLARFNIRTVKELLYHFPARYEDRRVARAVADLRPGEKEAFSCEVLFPASTQRMGGRQLTRVRVGDDTGRADLQWWNQPFREKQFHPGDRLFVYGKVSEYNGMLQIDSPEFEPIGEGEEGGAGRIVPVYPVTEGLYQSNLRKAVAGALERFRGELEDMLPEALRRQYGLMPLQEALQQIHFPDDGEQKEKARYRLVFEELFLLQLALAQRRNAARLEEIGVRHIVPNAQIKEFIHALPFKLTGAQKRVMNEVRLDLGSPRPMNRLLHGDVGAGKTMVAAYALWSAWKSGHQSALLAPTEILAEQHYSVLSRLLAPMGIEVGLLHGSLRAREKREMVAGIAEGRVHIVVGTHALIQEGIRFEKLGVCVVDEQHRFGVMQRAALAGKGYGATRPDVLVMTATPIPRTLALTIYGDLDVSVLDELPPGRQPIKTVKIRSNQRERAYQYVLKEIKKGRQAYVVCPLVEESEALAQLKAATALADHLRANELRDVRVGLVHGQMSAAERDEEMNLFRAGMRDVLVSTTVIEVGVDVPNATIMLVEDADRFGLSQLHQLRGRIGRGEHKSMCVLLADAKTDEARARLQVMTKTQDGFVIAEEDLQLRGPGEFYGTRQSGLPDFQLANIITDIEVIQLAREVAAELIAGDPHLLAPEHQAMKRELGRFWGEKIEKVQVS